MSTALKPGPARAARIGARIRHHLASPKWDWRFPSTPAVNDEDAAAQARLRADYARAARWLMLASEALGLPFALGNGSGGHWERVAVVDAAGQFGLLDIAYGRIAWTDAVIPAWVARFAVRSKSGSSPNIAGGSGSMGDAVAQLAIVHYSGNNAIVRAPAVNVVRIEYGLTTCYGNVGSAPSPSDYWKVWSQWMDRGVPVLETVHPQRERVEGIAVMAPEFAAWLKAGLPGWVGPVRIRECGVHRNGNAQVEFEVVGLPGHRAKTRSQLMIAHGVAARLHAELAVARARRDAGLATHADHELLGHPRSCALEIAAALKAAEAAAVL